MATIPNINKQSMAARRKPPQAVKSYFVCIANNDKAKHSTAVMPIAKNTYKREEIVFMSSKRFGVLFTCYHLPPLNCSDQL